MTQLHCMQYRSYWTLCAQRTVLLHSSLLQAAVIHSFSRQQGISCFSIATELPSVLLPHGSDAFLLVQANAPWMSDRWPTLNKIMLMPKTRSRQTLVHAVCTLSACRLGSLSSHAVLTRWHQHSCASRWPLAAIPASRQGLTKEWACYTRGELKSAGIKRWNPSVSCPLNGL